MPLRRFEQVRLLARMKPTSVRQCPQLRDVLSSGRAFCLFALPPFYLRVELSFVLPQSLRLSSPSTCSSARSAAFLGLVRVTLLFLCVCERVAESIAGCPEPPY